MDNYEWIDVTSDLQAIRKDLKLMEMIRDHQLTLEDCMQAQQIDDDKMDPKFDICYKHTIKSKLQQKLVKLPHQLTLRQIGVVFANVLQLQASALKGQPLSCSIYTFSYLYDRKICVESPLFAALIQSIHTLGSHIYNIAKQATTVKEDDVTISAFSFTIKCMSHDEVSEMLLQAEKKFQTQYKKNEDKQSFNFVLNTLRLRRSLHSFAKVSGIILDVKNIKKIQTELNSVNKKLTTLQQTKFTQSQGLMQGVFFNDLPKTLKVHFGPRVLKLTNLQGSLKQIRNVIETFQLFLPAIPNKISQMKNKIQILTSKPYNSWGKSFIKANLFIKQNYFFGSINSFDALISDIDDWIHLKQNVKQHDKFKNLIQLAGPVINETLYRLLGNTMRWHWEASKIYEDYNILIHMANQVDSTAIAGSKEFYVSSWFYYYGLDLMIKQMLSGFEINMFDTSELKYVLFVLENILGVFARNSQVLLKKLDKSLMQNFYQNNLNKKLKKKMNDNEKKMFANIIFKKGLHLYCRAIFNLLCMLHNKKLIDNKFVSTQQIRVKHRFRVFKRVLFTRIIDYKQYCKTLDEICSKQNEYLGNALEQLKEAKNVFSLFTKQFENDETFFKQKEDAQILTKLSVKASLIIMTLKMNSTSNKKFGIDLSGKFPDFTMQ